MDGHNEYSVSSDALSYKGYSNLAAITPDNRISAARLDTPEVVEEAKRLHSALQSGKEEIQGITAENLAGLLREAEEIQKSAQLKPSVSKDGTYKKGPLKVEVDPGTSFRDVSETQDVREMAEAVKWNINLMQSKVRNHWIRHFDDALLGSTLDLNQEYEHFGRMVTDIVGWGTSAMPFIGITGKDNADNIVTRGQHGAADVIDNLVAQYGNGSVELKSSGLLSQSKVFASTADRDVEIKKMLLKMNESVTDEADWVGMLFGLYLALKVPPLLLGGVLKGLLKLASIRGKGGIQLVALGAELYEKVDRRMKGADPANKTLWDSVKDRLKGEKLARAKPSDLTPEEKLMKDYQTEGVRSVLRDHLFDKYGKGMTREEFDKAVDKPGLSEKKNIANAKNSQDKIMKKISRHLPIDFTSSANDAYEIDQRMRSMALDMELSVWVKLRTGLYRFFLEKGAITNFLFQNRLVDLSNRADMGSYSKRVREYLKALGYNLDTVSIDIGEGQKVTVPRADEQRFKELMKHIDADIALVAQDAEMRALADLNKLQGEINILKARGIPDGEQQLNDKIRQLEEAKINYADFERLHNFVQSQRIERDYADKAVKDSQSELETAQEKLIDAKKRIQLYNEYYPLKRAHEEVELKKQSVGTKLNQEKMQVETTIKTLEGTLRSNGIVGFTDFSVSTTDADFLDKAQRHIRVLQAQVIAYNTSALKGSKLDINATFLGVNSDIQNVQNAHDTFVELKRSESTKKVELQTKIAELSSAGIWDMRTNSISKTLHELQQDEKVAQQDEKTAQKNLADGQEKLKKMVAGVDKTKTAIKDNPSRKIINKGTLRNPDGTVASRDIRTPAEIDAEIVQAQEMLGKREDKKALEEKLSKLRQARDGVAKKVGETADVKPKADGTHSASSQSFSDKMNQQKAEVQGTYTEYVRQAAAKGYTLEIKDGKGVLVDSTGKSLPFNTADRAQLAELLRKIK